MTRFLLIHIDDHYQHSIGRCRLVIAGLLLFCLKSLREAGAIKTGWHYLSL